MSYLVLVANYGWIFKRKSYNLRALIHIIRARFWQKHYCNKMRHVVNNTFQYSAIIWRSYCLLALHDRIVELKSPYAVSACGREQIGLVCCDCCFQDFRELPTFCRKPMSMLTLSHSAVVLSVIFWKFNKDVEYLFSKYLFWKIIISVLSSFYFSSWMSIHALISSFCLIFLKHEMLAVYLFMVACIRPVRG